MTLQQENRNAIVTLRLQRANETISEAKGNMQLGYWRIAVNRLYYACFYAASALLVKNGLTAHTHNGTMNQFGLHFVKKGLINQEQGKLFKQLFNLRQSGDYDDWFDIEEKDVKPLLEPAEKFIAEIENLIHQNS
ncbi:MAG: HEPN domain-containing protein [Tannerella sp.]|jgi:uncharacterized protein (UPF0332 family)|nr:HEPN domain-containing protein [Tannerella sp.]